MTDTRKLSGSVNVYFIVQKNGAIKLDRLAGSSGSLHPPANCRAMEMKNENTKVDTLMSVDWTRLSQEGRKSLGF